jgi:hypothetical protein
VNIDTELDTWRQAWQSQTEPLPDLKKKIKRQNLRMIGALVLIIVCLMFSTALAHRSSFMAGLAAGMWVASLGMGAYNLWVRRGAWKPTAQTTLAYAELSYKRAIAKAKTIRFAFYFLLGATALYGAFLVWRWKPLSKIEAPVLAGMAVELVFFQYLARRQRREIEASRSLMQRVGESPSSE